MSISDRTIKELLEKKDLIIEPLNPESLQPASIDLSLGKGFLVVDHHQVKHLTLEDPVPYRKIEGSSVIIPPHHFLLATTKEKIKLPPNISGKVEGRSSIGRRGLFIQNAGWIDPGFEGNITLELYNANESPLEIKSDRRICQLILDYTDKPVLNPYKGKYQKQTGTTGSMVHKDVELQETDSTTTSQPTTQTIPTPTTQTPPAQALLTQTPPTQNNQPTLQTPTLSTSQTTIPSTPTQTPTTNPTIIGLTGSLGSGKSIVANFLKENGFAKLTLSNILRNELTRNNLPESRKNLQDVGNKLRSEHGNHILAETAYNKIITEKINKAVIDGIRNPGEIEFLKKQPNFHLIAVDAPEEKRFEMLKERKRQGDILTWEEFQRLDARDKGIGEEEPGKAVAKCINLADHTLINDENQEIIKQRLENLYSNITDNNAL
ncbi:dCTP deaminase [Candidatus Pacearchaeota archaeon]|nr:dCTP deaminase [Candidatus Pacearchaeota archaeon]